MRRGCDTRDKKELNRGSQTLVQLFGGPVRRPRPRAPEKWPAWRLPKLSNSLLKPKPDGALNLRSTLVSLHRRLEPWLLGDKDYLGYKSMFCLATWSVG